MPWEVTWPMQERERLVGRYATGQYTVTELAEAFGVSRKTVHKWLARFKDEGLIGLADRSRAPHHHPNATPAAVVAAILEKKREHKSWGPLKLLPGEGAPPEVREAWPAPSTRGAILARACFVQPRRRRRRVAATGPLSSPGEANDLWCADFKGWFRTQDGRRCDPLTISDSHSRMLLRCEGLTRPDYAHSRPVFEAAFREYGLPRAIRTDNGPPFASVGAGGLAPLAVWWVKLGILLERIEPGHPEQNGRHERMHLTLKQECCQPAATDLATQQKRFDSFRRVFNQERPHQAIGLRPPASCYHPSPRPYRGLLDDPLYPPDALVRRVRSNGEIKWRGHLVFLSEALVGEAVGLRETELGHEVFFGPILLGHLYPSQERLIRPQNVRRRANL